MLIYTLAAVGCVALVVLVRFLVALWRGEFNID